MHDNGSADGDYLLTKFTTNFIAIIVCFTWANGQSNCKRFGQNLIQAGSVACVLRLTLTGQLYGFAGVVASTLPGCWANANFQTTANGACARKPRRPPSVVIGKLNLQTSASV